MEIRILGAHNLESAHTRLSSLLVDGILALDAGSLTSSLTLAEQRQIKAVLLTHRHFDHTRDLATLGLYRFLHSPEPLPVFSNPDALDAVARHLLNGVLYPALAERPSPQAPTLRLQPVEPGKVFSVEGYQVLPLPVDHGVPSLGYQVSGGNGKTFFYTGDTGPGLSECWRQARPDLIIIEVTLPSRMEPEALRVKHLTPAMLGDELRTARAILGRIPRTVVVHISPPDEKEIEEELAHLARELPADISLGHEGMHIAL